MVADRKTESTPSAQGPPEPADASTSDGPAFVHRYDDASLSALAFLHAVMQDQQTDIQVRMHAAEVLLGIDPDGYIVRQGHEEPTTIHVSGKGLH